MRIRSFNKLRIEEGALLELLGDERKIFLILCTPARGTLDVRSEPEREVVAGGVQEPRDRCVFAMRAEGVARPARAARHSLCEHEENSSVVTGCYNLPTLAEPDRQTDRRTT